MRPEERAMLRALAVGRRAPAEEEHDLDPIAVLVAQMDAEGSPYVACDDAGAIPAFAEIANANVAAEALIETGTVAGVAVQPCWRTFVSDTLLAASGRDAAEMTEEQVNEMLMKTYIVEATALDAGEVADIARETGRRIARGIARRQERGS